MSTPSLILLIAVLLIVDLVILLSNDAKECKGCMGKKQGKSNTEKRSKTTGAASTRPSRSEEKSKE